jgi:hypothetical protein
VIEMHAGYFIVLTLFFAYATYSGKLTRVAPIASTLQKVPC